VGSWVIPVGEEERKQRSSVELPIYQWRIHNHHPLPLSRSQNSWEIMQKWALSLIVLATNS
jgi:hypothetical protein